DCRLHAWRGRPGRHTVYYLDVGSGGVGVFRPIHRHLDTEYLLESYIKTISYCSCVYWLSTSSDIGLPMKSPSMARCGLSSSRNKSTMACEARMRNSLGLNCRDSRRISRRIS